MQETFILENRKEFIKSIKNEFIPICIKDNMKYFVIENQKDMFTTWDAWITCNKFVTYKGSLTHQIMVRNLEV